MSIENHVINSMLYSFFKLNLIVSNIFVWNKCYLKYYILSSNWSMAQQVKNLPAMQETQIWSLGQEDPLEEEMATHSSLPGWRIPWRENPGGLQSVGSQRVRHDWATKHMIHLKEWFSATDSFATPPSPGTRDTATSIGTLVVTLGGVCYWHLMGGDHNYWHLWRVIQLQISIDALTGVHLFLSITNTDIVINFDFY